jgi:hypothetical protein
VKAFLADWCAWMAIEGIRSLPGRVPFHKIEKLTAFIFFIKDIPVLPTSHRGLLRHPLRGFPHGSVDVEYLHGDGLVGHLVDEDIYRPSW